MIEQNHPIIYITSIVRAIQHNILRAAFADSDGAEKNLAVLDGIMKLIEIHTPTPSDQWSHQWRISPFVVRVLVNDAIEAWDTLPSDSVCIDDTPLYEDVTALLGALDIIAATVKDAHF